MLDDSLLLLLLTAYLNTALGYLDGVFALGLLLANLLQTDLRVLHKVGGGVTGHQQISARSLDESGGSILDTGLVPL